MKRGYLQLPRSRGSHLVSRLIRPFFEKKRAKASFGVALSVVSLGIASGPAAWENKINALEPEELAIVETAKINLAQPLPNMTGISQRFHALHPGIDITAPLGSPIYPVKPGKVVIVSISRQGYGRSVVVDHGDGLTSRYAHMGKIKVEEGEEVNEETVLGEVGLTGHTTGPHLHLEIRKNNLALNPLPYLRSN